MTEWIKQQQPDYMWAMALYASPESPTIGYLCVAKRPCQIYVNTVVEVSTLQAFTQSVDVSVPRLFHSVYRYM